MPILEVQHLYKNFGSTKVLKDISFTLERGKALAIIGSSGSGKTTLLRCLNFLETPNEGKIIVNGETLLDAADHAAKSDAQIRKNRLHFGMVFQSFNLFPQYTALENVMLAPLLQAKERPDYKQKKHEIHEQIEHRAIELLEMMSLEGRMSHYPHQLSAAARCHCACARAQAGYPVLRRADLGARPRADRRGAARYPLTGGPAHHHDHRHPRDGVCPRCGRSCRVHGRRHHR